MNIRQTATRKTVCSVEVIVEMQIMIAAGRFYTVRSVALNLDVPKIIVLKIPSSVL